MTNGDVKLSIASNDKLSVANDIHFGATDINFGKRQRVSSNIQIPHGLGVRLDKPLARVHGVTHQHVEGPVGFREVSPKGTAAASGQFGICRRHDYSLFLNPSKDGKE